MADEEGYFRHDRNLAEFLRRYGAKGLEAGGALPVHRSVQPVTLVDDASGLSGPLAGPVGRFGGGWTTAALNRHAGYFFASPATGGLIVTIDFWNTGLHEMRAEVIAAGAVQGMTTIRNIALNWFNDVGLSSLQLGDELIAGGPLPAIVIYEGGVGPAVNSNSRVFFVPPGGALRVAGDAAALFATIAGHLEEIPARPNVSYTGPTTVT